ncbi:DUF2231 domain-containing protein [Catalinimonas niigatensis]|uniref:DUF2231 domain-containing protein n=1 Tax=Catalinimonas niigatensis TaxID=1397264 RepID=UPI002665E8FB|nr:DUF2231 domain-containing protein [Catalinimonas niigatensis]WPP50740.1 DUF2231 domain-containing protein [Catalinimonas niigatensis]
MNEIPSMWRTELWHPLSVHFPIAILSLAAVIGMAYLLFKKKDCAPYLRFTLSLLLWCGVVLFWIAFYTGQEAYSVVVRQICDPRVLKSHLFWAYIAGTSFSLAALLDVMVRLVSLKFKSWITFGAIVLMLGGTICITYVGHLGARLVYQQAAGVYQPSEDCIEFE